MLSDYPFLSAHPLLSAYSFAVLGFGLFLFILHILERRFFLPCTKN